MDGYVLNKSNGWAHAMKQQVRPGGNIPLDDLYEMYGIKHGIEEGSPFIEWLRNVKLKGKSDWEVILNTEVDKQESPKEVTEKSTGSILSGALIDNQKFSDKGSNVTPVVVKDMEISDIVGLSVRKAREVIPTIMDVKSLRYSLQEAKTRSGKDSLCNILKKRINELDDSRD